MKKNMIFAGLRDFLILWGSQTISSLGTAMTNFALVIWVYEQGGTAFSITLLTICIFLPTILFRFIAGTIADRWDKKRIMLVADLAAALGTGTVFVLYAFAALRPWHLYGINFLLSFMDAFQVPAAHTATSLLVPREQYVRVSGLHSFSGSVVSILAPALGSILLAFGGLQAVLIVDLVSFAIAFITLLLFIKIPPVARTAEKAGESFWESCLAGIRFLREQGALLRLILFFSVVNFLAKMGGDGMMPVFVLSRTGGDQKVLGMVQTAVALGILVGSVLVTLMKPAKSKTTVVFCSVCITFFMGAVQSVTPLIPVWIAAAFLSYIPVAFTGANLTAVMRDAVPIAMQGRVFSARDTIMNGTIPLGLFLGGVLTDHVFEPFMVKKSPLQGVLSFVFGEDKGAGIALLFCMVGILGLLISFAAMKNPIYHSLNEKQ
jgi:MFS family permease